MDPNPSTPLDPRPAFSREKFFEGDIRTFYCDAFTLANAAHSAELDTLIPPRVKNDIAEILEISMYATSAAVYLFIDGFARPTTILNGAGMPFPVHKPALPPGWTIGNYAGADAYNVSFGIRYRRKVPNREA